MPNIIIFGGAFDPVHTGHIITAIAARNFLTQQDHKEYEIWVTPSYFDTLGEKQLTSGEHRTNMLKLAFKNEYSAIPDTLICTLELESSNRMGTYELMKELERQYPKYNFRFLMGADTGEKIRQWRNSRKFVKEMKTIIVPRRVEERARWGSQPLLKRTVTPFQEWTNCGTSNQHLKMPVAVLPEAISSTHIRKLVAENNWLEANKYLPGSVLEYIKDNGLYQEEKSDDIKSKAGAHLP